MNLPSDCRLTVEKNPSWADCEFADEAWANTTRRFCATGLRLFRLFVRDTQYDPGRPDGKLPPAGCHRSYGCTPLRRAGIGSGLVAEAERRASGLSFAHVDTFSFQGPDFYPRFGYEVFELDYP